APYRDQAMRFGSEGRRARAQLTSRDREHVALVTVGKVRARLAAQVVRECPSVRAEHAEHEVRTPRDGVTLAGFRDDAPEQTQVAQHAEQGQERQRDEVMRLATGAAPDDLKHLR